MLFNMLGYKCVGGSAIALIKRTHIIGVVSLVS